MLPVLSWLKLYVPPRPVVVVARTSPLVSSSCTVSPASPCCLPPPRGPLPRRFIVTVPLIDALNRNTSLCRLVRWVLASMNLARVFPWFRMSIHPA